MSEKLFKPHKYQCTDCEDIIFSSRPGEFVTCKCGAISVDETLYYTRWIGQINKFRELKDED
jgi:hypothetical protein